MQPLVSILIPAYNAEKWIHACINSVISQAWSRKEIIAVDDGSSDNTLEILRRFESPIVKVVHQENRGASSARNLALSFAQGDYIQWLDADDIIASDKIYKQLFGIDPRQDSQTLLSCSWGKFYHSPRLAKFTPDSLWQNLEPIEWLLIKINENLWMPPICWLVSRELTEKTGPWNEALSLDDDGEYFSRVLQYSKSVRFSKEAHCFKRITIGLSSTYSISQKKLKSQSFSIFNYIHILRNMEDSPRVRDACIKLLNRWAVFYFPEEPKIIDKMQMYINELGGSFEQITLRKKYRLLGVVLGWRAAKKAQFVLPIIRYYKNKQWERVLSRLSGYQGLLG